MIKNLPMNLLMFIQPIRSCSQYESSLEQSYNHFCVSWIKIAIAEIITPESEYPIKFERKSVPNTKEKSELMISKARARSALPAQIGGIVGAYLISVGIVYLAARFLGWRLRNRLKLQSGNDVDKELSELQFRGNLDKNVPPIVPTPSETLNRQQSSVDGNNCTPFFSSSALSPLTNSNHRGQNFDMEVLEAHRETLSQDLRTIYAHVLAQEEEKAAAINTKASSQRVTSVTYDDTSHRRRGSKKLNKKQFEQLIRPNLKAVKNAVDQMSAYFIRIKSSREKLKSARQLNISYPIVQTPTGFFPQWNDSIRDSSAPRILNVDDQCKISDSKFVRNLPIYPAETLDSSKIKASSSSWSCSSQSSSRIFDRTLPLRDFDSHPQSSSFITETTKTTILERKDRYYGPETGDLSIPWSAGPVPYSPYEPGSMMMQVSPMLTTKEDRKRQKRLEPKTPISELVKSDNELWDDAYQ